MEKQKMTREQLIDRIDDLDKKVVKFETDQLEEPKIGLSNESFRILINTAPVGLIITNPQGDILNANKAIQDLLGYTLSDSKLKNIVDFYADPNERQRLWDIMTKYHPVSNFETKIKHIDGSIKTVLINSDYIELDQEKALLTSVYDITQLHQIQEDLKKSEKEYHQLFSNAPVGITVTDTKGFIAAHNQAIQELLGYSAEEMKNITARDFYFDVSDRQILLDLTKNLGCVRDFETKFKNKEGRIITVLLNTDLIDFKDQHGILLTSIRDISSLKQIEDDLTDERDFTNAILNIAASLMMTLDREGKILKFNHACEKTTGYTLQDVKGKYIWDFLSIIPSETKDRIDRLLAGFYPSTHESVWISKSGEHRLISWTNTALLDNAGKVAYIIATGIDITEQRKAEIELKEANHKLVSWVKELEERTTELNQLNEMGELLQNCQTVHEAYALSTQYIQMIWPKSQGALYLMNPTKDAMESVETWGESSYTEDKFMPLSCWAIRRGRPHLVDDAHPGLRCEHITGPHEGHYLCAPMIINGEIMGTVHLSYTLPDDHQQESKTNGFSEHKIQLVVAIVEHIALALSNLNLRETLRQQSIRDILTGLFNRRYMEESLERELHRALREKKTVGVIMFDIDHFKDFNDQFGHDGGDSLLRELGNFFNKNTRASDVVARYGGEEFVIIMPGASLEQTRIRAQEFRQAVKELLVYHLGKPLGRCTISLGVAAYPEHGTSIDKLLKNADNALYLAKNEGRDRVVVAPSVD